jgi:3-methyladenine DNA glycosylase AlkD
MGAIREVVKTLAWDSRSKDDLLAIALTLWSRPIFEPRMACVLLLERCAPNLSLQDLPAIEKLIRESRTWALVDPLAVNVTGELILRHQDALQVLERWSTDEDFWIRRSLLLAHLKPLRRGLGDSSFYHHADIMLSEKEFFIRKAIGWVLREIAKRNPAEVFEWLAPRTHIASGVTMREATKYLDEHQRHTLMAAYKETRPASVQS